MTNKNANIETIITMMESESIKQSMPMYYRSDLDIDYSVLRNGVSNQYVWVLRESGTQLGPVGIGYDPVWITSHTSGAYSMRSSKFYVIDVANVSIMEVTGAKADALISKEPSIMLSCDAEGIVKSARSVLEYGIVNRVWGLFEQPNAVDQYTLTEWESYFKTYDNKPMITFMRNVNRKLSALRHIKSSSKAA